MIIIKAGGSAITKKSEDFTPNMEVISNVAQEIKDAGRVVILVHGAGSYGHPIAKKYSLGKGYVDEYQLKGFSETRSSISELDTIILKALMQNGLTPVKIGTFSNFITSNGRIVEFHKEPLLRAIELGLLPVFTGDLVFDRTRVFSILSGDQIVSYLSKLLKPSRVIFGTDVDGICTGDPKKEKAKLIENISEENINEICEFTKSIDDASGGMEGKFTEIFSIFDLGIEIDVINLTKKGNLASTLQGNVKGTVIKKKNI
ncbi:MAG: isopentenyl phosphate kinase family protein [Candidatus Methanofastidiosa archaeon]|nr:isopentenyl phosphate kinase family protein [Candidatus Methanofastidiosa archaeon]